MCSNRGLSAVPCTTVVIGVEIGRPKKTSELDRLPNLGSTVLFNADWTVGRRLGQALKGSLYSRRRALMHWISSRHTTSTVPFDHDVYARVR
jgi:hypothetical protein